MGLIDALQTVSLLIAILGAVYGIDSWRREHKGKRQMELAEDTLALFYEAADAISYIRHPVSLGHELKDIEQGEGESDKAYKARKNASIVYVRYDLKKDTFNRLHAMRYRFMAQIGKDQAKAFDDLREIVNSIHVSANMLARLWPRDSFPSTSAWESHNVNVQKYEAHIWEGDAEDDPIQPKLTSALSDIESVCKEVISGKGTIYAFLNWRISRN
jgi:hypothetical protein